MASDDSSSGGDAPDGGASEEGDVAAVVDPEVAATYNPAALLDLYDVAMRAVGDMNKKPQTVRDAADALCDFFHALLEDDVFWAAVERAGTASAERVARLIALVPSFEKLEHRLLRRAGVREPGATRITVELTSAMRRFEPGDSVSADAIKRGITRIESDVCDREIDFGSPEAREALSRQCWKGAAVAGAAAGIAAALPVAVAAAPVLGVFAGVVAIAGIVSGSGNDD